MNSVLRVNAARIDKINLPHPGESHPIFNLHDYKIRNFNINIMLYIYIVLRVCEPSNTIYIHKPSNYARIWSGDDF